MRGIVGKDFVITGYKDGPQKGTLDLRVEYVKLPPPTPEKFQPKARMRRLRQQLRDGAITYNEFLGAELRVGADFDQKP